MAGPVQVKGRGFPATAVIFAAAAGEEEEDDDDDAWPDSSAAVSLPLPAEDAICRPHPDSASNDRPGAKMEGSNDGRTDGQGSGMK